MAGPRALVTRRLPPGAMRELATHCDLDVWEGATAMPRPELLARAGGIRALVTLLTERVDEELLDAAGPALAVVANFAVGVDNIDVAACTGRGVLVTNTPDVLTEATADMTWALLLAAARRVAEADRFLRTGQPWIWGPEMMLGQEVTGRTLGIIGYGRIGRAVALRAAGFRMRVVVHDPHLDARLADPPAEAVGLEELLSTADFVSVHTALTDETRHLLDAGRLELMKPTAVLVNVSRGPVVDERALAAALDRGVIFAAGLDVYEREPAIDPGLVSHPRVVLAPHLGSATVGTRDAMGSLVVENVAAALAGRRPPSLVNPEAWKG